MEYAKVFKQIGEELNISPDLVNKAYRSYWQFIRETAKALPLKEDLSKEDFSKLRTNFNLPSLGKLYCTYETMQKRKAKYNYIKTKHNVENKED